VESTSGAVVGALLQRREPSHRLDGKRETVLRASFGSTSVQWVAGSTDDLAPVSLGTRGVSSAATSPGRIGLVSPSGGLGVGKDGQLWLTESDGAALVYSWNVSSGQWTW
jgi:hypothetical protein